MSGLEEAEDSLRFLVAARTAGKFGQFQSRVYKGRKGRTAGGYFIDICLEHESTLYYFG